MSNYLAPAYHPVEKVIRTAWWMDDYFGRHRYGVQFDDEGEVFKPEDVAIPNDKVFVVRSEEYKRGLERAAEIAKEFDRYDVVAAIREEKDKV